MGVAKLLRLWFAAGVVVASLLLAGCGEIPGASRPHYNTIEEGRAFLLRNDLPNAQAKFDAAIKARPNDPNVYQLIADCLRRAGRYDLTLHYLDAAAGPAKSFVPADRLAIQSLRAEALLQLQRYDEALKTQLDAYNAAQSEPVAANNLAYLYARLPLDKTDIARGIELATRAVQSARDSGAPDEEIGTYVDTLGWLRFRKGDYEAAVRDLARAADLCVSQPVVHAHLSLAYARVNRMADASAEMAIALKMASTDPDVQELKAELDHILTSATDTAPAPAGSAPPSYGGVVKPVPDKR